MQERVTQVIDLQNNVLGLTKEEDENDWKKSMKNLFACINLLD